MNRSVKETILKVINLIPVLGLVIVQSGCNPIGKVTKGDLQFGRNSDGSSETESIYTWNFSTSSDYIVSDSEKIVLSSGANLQEIDQTHNSSADFNGSHLGTTFLNSNLQFKTISYYSLDGDWAPNGLVGYWKFEGDFNDTVGTSNGSAAGDATTSPDSYLGTGSSIFDGSSDQINITTNSTAVTNYNDNFSVSFWMKYDVSHDVPSALFSRVIRFNCSSGYTAEVRVYDQASSFPGRIRAIRYDGSTNNGVNFVEGLNSDWNHYVMVKSGSDWRTYLNGEKVDEITDSTTSLVTCDDLKFGMTHYKGFLDEVGLYNTDLSDDDVSLIYNRQAQTYLAADDTSLNSAWTPQYDSMVGYWKMDGNWRDSIGSKHGTAFADAAFTSTKKVGSHGGIFDGTGDYVDIGDINQDLYSLSMWIEISGKVTSASGSETSIITFQDGAGHNQDTWLHFGSVTSACTGEVITILKTFGPAGRACVNDITIQPGWHHLVLSWNTSLSKYDIYLDGVAQTVTSGSIADVVLIHVDNLRFGTHGSTPDYSDTFFNGKLDDIAIWSSSLSSAEIKLIYNRQKQKFSGLYTSSVIDTGSTSSTWTAKSWTTELPFYKEMPGVSGEENTNNYVSLDSTNALNSNLVALWRYNESSWSDVDDEVKDYSGNLHHGRAKGGSNTVENSILARGGDFDGVDDYLTLGQSNQLKISTGEFTFATWIFRNDSSSSRPFGNYPGGAFTKGVFYFRIDSPDRYYFDIGHDDGGGSGYQCRTGSNAASYGKWEHFAFVYSEDAGAMKIYINGKEHTNTTGCTINLGPTSVLDTTQELRIGAIPAGSYLNGKLDETALWSRSLSANEISQLYRRGANRVKMQVRSCDDVACSGESWLGANGSASTWFSELNNCDLLVGATGACDFSNGAKVKTSSPSILFSDYTSLSLNSNRYFQYRILMESDDESSTPSFPSVSSLSVGPDHYPVDSPTVTTAVGPEFSTWSGFSETKTGSCSVSYQVSPNRSHWYYHNGTNWVAASNSSQKNSAQELSNYGSTFASDVGTGTLYLKAFLESDGTQNCQLTKMSATVLLSESSN